MFLVLLIKVGKTWACSFTKTQVKKDPFFMLMAYQPCLNSTKITTDYIIPNDISKHVKNTSTSN